VLVWFLNLLITFRPDLVSPVHWKMCAFGSMTSCRIALQDPLLMTTVTTPSNHNCCQTDLLHQNRSLQHCELEAVNDINNWLDVNNGRGMFPSSKQKFLEEKPTNKFELGNSHTLFLCGYERIGIHFGVAAHDLWSQHPPQGLDGSNNDQT